MPRNRNSAGDEERPICKNCLRAKRYCDHSREIKFQHHAPHCVATEEQAECQEPLTILQDPGAASLLRHYVKYLAAWYDLSDANASFAKLVPLEALSRPLLLNAILAFSAIHFSRTAAPSMRSTAERFHSSCVKQLLALKADELRGGGDGVTLASVCLLRSYEILGEEVDPNRHLSGAFALAASGSLNLHTPGLLRGGFFNYLREDITFSLIHRCPLKINLNGVAIPEDVNDDEDQLNVAALFLANTINHVFGEVTTQASSVALEHSFTKWKSSIPVQFTPYFEKPPNQAALQFPTIRMLQDCHVAVLQYTLVTESVRMLLHSEDATASTLHSNATRICGLAFSSESAAVVVNSFGPISFSCRYLQSQPLRIELVRRLQASRKETGWPVHRIINDLEQNWNSVGDQTKH